MKIFIFILCLLGGFFTQAQTIQKFYDWKWDACDADLARFYSKTVHTDSGWFRRDYYTSNNYLQMQGLYSDAELKVKHGTFIYLYPNGVISSTGKYVDGRKDGLWLSYHYDGSLTDSSVYKTGKLTGTSIGWHSNGFLSDSMVIGNDGTAVNVYWFDNGNPSAAGHMVNNKQEGKWLFYHKNGNMAAQEQYHDGKLINKSYFNEAGSPVADTSASDKEAEFPGGNSKWKKFLGNNLRWPHNYKIINSSMITVVVSASVDEEGNLSDIYVEIPFKPPFDDEVLRVMKKSPQWIPAKAHNRNVKTHIRLPFTFSEY